MVDILRVKKKNEVFVTVNGDPSVLNELTDFFTFFVPGYKFMPAYKNKLWDGKIRLFDSRTRELYAGLYPYLKEFADVEGRNYTIELEHDSYYGYPETDTPIDISFMNEMTITSKGQKIDPRDYQLEAIQHALTKKRALLVSPTASGKSLIIY